MRSTREGAQGQLTVLFQAEGFSKAAASATTSIRELASKARLYVRDSGLKDRAAEIALSDVNDLAAELTAIAESATARVNVNAARDDLRRSFAASITAMKNGALAGGCEGDGADRQPTRAATSLDAACAPQPHR